MIKKLRIKFVIINMSIVLLLLCIIFGLIFYFTKANLESGSINMMRTIAERPFHTMQPGKHGEDIQLPFFVVQLGPNGEQEEVIGGYYDLSDEDAIDKLLETVLSSDKQWGVIQEYSLRYYHSDNPMHRSVVFADISNELSTLRGLISTCLIIGALSFIAFLAASFFLSKWAVKPVAQALTQQRQFIADASHELKTPLTVILTNAEFLQSPDYDDKTKLRFSDNIVTMAQKMRGLTERLLELARLDNGQMQTAFSCVDMSKLTTDAMLPFEPVFFEKGLSLESNAEAGIRVTGGAEQLGEVVGILLDNAQKYSDAGGKTRVMLEKLSGRHCLLRVENEGAPIGQAELESLFKRFYRADQARSGDGSFGLGLSIAESIVHVHKGRIWAESKDGLNTFFVELPLTQE